MPSTCPCTMWPPMRSDADRARSKFTEPPADRSPREVRRMVSGERSTENSFAARATAVRQAPLTAMLSPSFRSDITFSAPTVIPLLLMLITEPTSSTIPVNIGCCSTLMRLLIRRVVGAQLPVSRLHRWRLSILGLRVACHQPVRTNLADGGAIQAHSAGHRLRSRAFTGEAAPNPANDNRSDEGVDLATSQRRTMTRVSGRRLRPASLLPPYAQVGKRPLGTDLSNRGRLKRNHLCPGAFQSLMLSKAQQRLCIRSLSRAGVATATPPASGNGCRGPP